jgi:hypothetical protein
MERPLQARFVVFRERHNHGKMSDIYMPDHASKIETTFRMGLKCGMHYLFDDFNPVHINSLHFHGSEHYQRNVENERVIGRLKNDLREYCSMNDFIDDRSGNNTKSYAQSYDDCQLLQLTDLMIGAFRTAMGESKNPIQREASAPVLSLVEKWHRGPARMKNSRWNKAYCITECFIDNGKWNFENIIRINRDNKLF